MAKKIPASFIKAEHVVFVGYSKRPAAYCKSVREAFEARSMKVHAVNPAPGDYDVKVYAKVEDVPYSPEIAVVITNKSRNQELLATLAAKGVERVMFGSSVSVDAGTLAQIRS